MQQIFIEVLVYLFVELGAKFLFFTFKKRKDQDFFLYQTYPGLLQKIRIYFVLCLLYHPYFSHFFSSPYDLYYNRIINIFLGFNTLFTSFLLVEYFLYIYEVKEYQAYRQILPFLKKIIKIFLTTCCLFYCIKVLGYSISTLLAGLGIGGLAIALAAQESLSNFIASFVLFMDKPFSLGDIIKVDNLEGEIIDFGLKSTTLQSSQNILYIVPNKTLVSSSIENISRLQKRTVKQILKIQPSSHLTIESFLKNVMNFLQSDERVFFDRAVFFAFSEQAIEIHIQYRLKNFKDYHKLNNELNLAFLELLEKNHLKLMIKS